MSVTVQASGLLYNNYYCCVYILEGQSQQQDHYVTKYEDHARRCTVVDLIKQRKLKLFGHIYRMNDNRLIKTVMLGWLKATDLAEDQLRNGLMIGYRGMVLLFAD